MSIKVCKDGFTIEVNTKEELDAVLASLGARQFDSKSMPPEVEDERLLDLYKSLSSEQQKLLKEISDSGQEGIQDDLLREKMGIATGQGLGGVLGGVGKRARKLNASDSDIYQRIVTRDGHYTYKLTANMLKMIRNRIVHGV